MYAVNLCACSYVGFPLGVVFTPRCHLLWLSGLYTIDSLLSGNLVGLSFRRCTISRSLASTAGGPPRHFF